MSSRPLNTNKFNIPPSVHASLEIFSANSNRSVFVRDLPFCCNTEDLRSLLEKEGGIKVEDILICRNSEGKTLQYGCAMFPSPDDVETVMEKLNGHRYHGRDIRVIRFSKDTLMEASSTGAVLVSFKGISHDLPLITESTIRAAFEQFGEISHVSIRSHLYNSYGIQGGFGFLGFVDSATNNRVVSEINQTVIEGVQYDCNWSKHISKSHEGNNSNGQPSESFFKRKPRDGNSHYFAGANSQFRSSASGNGQVPMYPSFQGPSQGVMVSVPGQFVYPGMYPSPGQSLPGQYNGPNAGIPAGGMMIPANAGYYQGQNMMVSGPNPVQGMPTALTGNDNRNHQQGQAAAQMNPSNAQFGQNGPNAMPARSHHVERAHSNAGTSAQPKQGQQPSFPSSENHDASHHPARTDRPQTMHHGHASSKSIISASPASNQHTPSSSSSTVPSPVPFVPSPTPAPSAVLPTPSPKQLPTHLSYPSNPHGHQQAQLQYSNNHSTTPTVNPAQQQGRGFSPVSAPSEGKLPSPNNVQSLQNPQWAQQQSVQQHSVQMGNIVPPSPGGQVQGWNGTTTTPILPSSGSAHHPQQQAYHYPPVNNTLNVKAAGQHQGNHETSPTMMTMLPPAAVGGPATTNNNGRYPAHHPSYPQPPQSHYGYQPAYQQPSVSMVHPMDATMHQQMMMFNAASVPAQLNQYVSPHTMPVPPPMSVAMPYMMVDGHNHMIMPPQMYAAYNPTVPGGPYSSGPVATSVSPPSQFMATNEMAHMDQKDNRNQQQQQQQHSHTSHYHMNHHTKARNVHHDGQR